VHGPVTELLRDLVLVGGGHAHVLALRMLAMKPLAGVRITLISPASHSPYSGMLPGLVAGHYSFEQSHIDLARLCQWAGVRFLTAEVVGINPQQKTLELWGRPEVHYDLVSLDIGSEPELESVPGAREWATPVKPVSQLWRRWTALAARLQGPEVQGITVVGGGAGSVELVLAMAQAIGHRPVQFELICGAGEILSGYNAGARQAVMKALSERAIAVRLNARVVAVESGSVLLADGERLPFDELFWCTGAAAAPWLAASDLQTDSRGFIETLDTLQSVNYDTVFAAGDVGSQRDNPRPKAGVFAVRQGAVLAENLRGALGGTPLEPHRPQRRFLSLISLGGKKATADRGFLYVTGNWVWRWKDRIDREFMGRFERLPTMVSRGDVEPRESRDAKTARQMPCGGCGAKVGADALRTVLTELAARFPQHCLSGGQAQDSAPIPASGAGQMVQSIDVLREMVADPWTMGRIAANHALSDLYACGATPRSALATVTLPFASQPVQYRELKQLLAGALHEFSAVNCQLCGGHTLQGPELSIGFVVNGSPGAGHQKLLTKNGLQVGDQLLLTKALGTGALFASHMQLKADGRHIRGAVEGMLQSNFSAAELALEYSATACTDVTGFGLLGHLLEMLVQGQGASLSLAEIPLLPGARESIQGGVRSSMHETNSVAKAVVAHTGDPVDAAAFDLLVDPQTSGGLLIGIGADRAAELCASLRAAGYESTAIVGEVTSHNAGEPGLVHIR
jgi:selenide, water dikinase